MGTVFLLGDSTCATKMPNAWPEAGWGMCFAPFLAWGWRLDNRAVNGLSSRLALSGGVFERLASSLSSGDWVVIQFGHNEDKPDEARHTWPWTTYGENLAYMITRIRMKGAFPVLLSSIERRRFREGKAYDTLGEYPWAMAAVAVRLGVPFFDLTTPTLHLLDDLGEQGSRRLFNQGIWPNYPDGVEDNTHLSLYGAQSIAGMVANLLSPLPFVLQYRI